MCHSAADAPRPALSPYNPYEPYLPGWPPPFLERDRTAAAVGGSAYPCYPCFPWWVATSRTLPVGGIGLEDRVRAGKTLGVLLQSLPAVEEPTRPWSAQDRQATQRVATDTRQMLASGERDFVWLTELIADRQQQFELAFGSWFSTAPLAPQMMKTVSDELAKRGGVTHLALEALARLGDAELRREVLGDGKQRLSGLGAYCMISAGIVGAEVASGLFWEAAATVATMAASGCTDL